MNDFHIVFKIIDEKRCPLYEEGELLSLSEKTLSCPDGKEVCLILVRDMTQLLFQYLTSGSSAPKKEDATIHNCSGCAGLIKFSALSSEEQDGLNRTEEKSLGARIDSAVAMRMGRVLDSEFLSTFPTDRIDEILEAFRVIELEPEIVLINKGEMNRNLYIIMEGRLAVEDGSIHLASLSEGDLCGEMSYLGADPAVATVKTIAKTKLLAIEGKEFGHLLGDNQPVQTYMARLLARRLQKNNDARIRDFEACMTGTIGTILPAELFQVFHMHQKTGVLAMEMPGGEARVSFREGCIINASFRELNNEEAIFEILAARHGNYSFTAGLSPKEMRAAEIGDFMMLLMEGVKRVDEN